MNLAALMTSAGVNIGVCAVSFSLYSILRKQPRFKCVYFGQKLSQVNLRQSQDFSFDRFVPSAGWIFKAWEASHEEVYASVGLDGLVFLRVIIFSIRIFAIAGMICVFLVLPANYYGKDMLHNRIQGESLEVFSIENIEPGSRWYVLIHTETATPELMLMMCVLICLAAAIKLPEQIVIYVKFGLAVNKKGLTLKELLQQTSHHNARVRKDKVSKFEGRNWELNRQS